MFERWVSKARGHLGDYGPKFFRWMRIMPPGLWIVIAVTALVAGRVCWLKSQRPQHLHEIAAAYGSISMLKPHMQFSHDCSQFVYVAATDTRGAGLFLGDTATRKKQLLVVEKDGNGMWRDFFDIQPWPWSPDDRAFIYSLKGKLILFPLDTNSPKVELTLPTNAVVSDVVWLSPSEFVWLEGESLCQARRSTTGQWDTQRWPRHGQFSNLTAVGPHSIAWFQQGMICRLDLTGTNNPFVPHSETAPAVPATNSLVLWLDASTLQQPNHSPVKALADLSRQHNPALAVNRPRFNAPGSPNALNGKGTIHFQSGASPAQATGLKTKKDLGIGGSEPRSIFAVERRNNKGHSSMLLNFGNATNQIGHFGMADCYDFFAFPSGVPPERRLRPLRPSWHILESIYDGVTNHGYVGGFPRIMKKQSYKTISQEVEIGMCSVNARSRTNAVGSDGDFAELLIYDRALDSVEQRQVESYLNAKWFGKQRLSTNDDSSVWFPEIDHLTDFSYSPATGKLLLVSSENGMDTLWQLDTANQPSGDPEQIFQGRFLQNVRWTGPETYACLDQEPSRRGLILGDLSGKQNTPLLQHDEIHWFQITPDQKKILFWGNVSNDPGPEIWAYDIVTGQLQSLFTGAAQPSRYAQKTKPYSGLVQLTPGKSIRCTIYPPANFDRHKKYPLVIGDTYIPDPIYGRWLQSGMAACGAYVVFVERKYWLDGIKNWETNVMAVYDYLRQDPCIDTDRVYLIGASAETQYLSECLQNSPGLWKGAIFLNPTALPDFSHSPPFQSRPKILISAGSEEHQEQRLSQYQRDALSSGALVECLIHPTETHRLVGVAGKLDRIQAITKFIFED